MSIYIGIEDLVANALIELVERSEKKKFCLSSWMNMGLEL